MASTFGTAVAGAPLLVGVVAVAVLMLRSSSGLRAFKEVVSLGKLLPDELKPKWFDSFAAGVDRFEGKVAKAGKDTTKWGLEAMESWGKSAGRFNDWLDRALAPKPKAPEAVKPLAALDADAAGAWSPLRLAGAFEKGSKEAYSVEMRARYGEFAPKEDNVHKENGKKLDKNTDALKRIEKQLGALQGKIDEAEVI